MKINNFFLYFSALLLLFTACDDEEPFVEPRCEVGYSYDAELADCACPEDKYEFRGNCLELQEKDLLLVADEDCPCIDSMYFSYRSSDESFDGRTMDKYGTYFGEPTTLNENTWSAVLYSYTNEEEEEIYEVDQFLIKGSCDQTETPSDLSFQGILDDNKIVGEITYKDRELNVVYLTCPAIFYRPAN